MHRPEPALAGIHERGRGGRIRDVPSLHSRYIHRRRNSAFLSQSDIRSRRGPASASATEGIYGLILATAVIAVSRENGEADSASLSHDELVRRRHGAAGEQRGWERRPRRCGDPGGRRLPDADEGGHPRRDAVSGFGASTITTTAAVLAMPLLALPGSSVASRRRVGSSTRRGWAQSGRQREARGAESQAPPRAADRIRLGPCAGR